MLPCTFVILCPNHILRPPGLRHAPLSGRQLSDHMHLPFAFSRAPHLKLSFRMHILYLHTFFYKYHLPHLHISQRHCARRPLVPMLLNDSCQMSGSRHHLHLVNCMVLHSIPQLHRVLACLVHCATTLQDHFLSQNGSSLFAPSSPRIHPETLARELIRRQAVALLLLVVLPVLQAGHKLSKLLLVHLCTKAPHCLFQTRRPGQSHLFQPSCQLSHRLPIHRR